MLAIVTHAGSYGSKSGALCANPGRSLNKGPLHRLAVHPRLWEGGGVLGKGKSRRWQSGAC
jgi:hypothetical protein